LISSLVIAAILAFFIVSVIRQQRQNLRLYQWSIAAEIRTLEKERSDLHDELGPLLSAIKYKLAVLEVAKEEQTLLNQVDRHLNDLVHRMRAISNDLLPLALVHQGLPAAIQEFLHQLETSGELSIQFHVHEFPELPREKSIHLYRMVTEIVHNTLKHAGATLLDIEITREGESLMMRCTDNGQGFNFPQRAKDRRGLGLNNILSRTEMVAGRLRVESAPGKGTRYQIEIPLKNPSL
jgi:signal transduction histidine kinase